MSVIITKIESNADNKALDQMIDHCLNNQPFTRYTIQLIKAENFFNSESASSIRSAVGFLNFYDGLSEFEKTGLKALFKFMKVGLHIYLAFQEPSGDIRTVSDLLIPSEMLNDDMIFMVGYHLDEHNTSTNYVGGRIPTSQDLIKLITSYNDKTINCDLSLEDLYFEAMKEQSKD